MASDAKIKTGYDIEEVGAAIAARFDALPWGDFTHHEKPRKDALINEIFDIQREVLKLGARDMRKAADIWDAHVPTFVPRPWQFNEPQPEPVIQNIIEPGRRKRRVTPEPWLDEPVKPTEHQTRSKQTDPDQPGDTRPDDPKAARHRMLMEGLEKQYHKANDRYHFRDRGREVAFEAHAKRLITEHETPAVVASMIDLAETRGWETLKLSGTDAFRREAWLQASVRGLDVTGYRPTKLDRARLEELREEFNPAANSRNIVQDQTNPTPSKVKSGFANLEEKGQAEPRPELAEGQGAVLAALAKVMRARGDSDQAIELAQAMAAEKLGKGRVHVGKLVESGTAPYQDKTGQAESHYVVLEDDGGRRQKIWGVDLPRALEEGKVNLGDKMALAFRGQKTVTATVRIPTEDGKGFGLEKRDVERNAWEAVKFDRLRADIREKVSPPVHQPSRPSATRELQKAANPRWHGRERVR